eukprot:TRINITY_DN3714_c0_g1_i1.p1 TRINITY_DN3714_c0_g1~~TRINITY_DN3714_c0_g1_i1.p1  ORF type:complete len:197 (+),score=13.14 TRINITY_DN3714_c0_g1_i1:39-629(+)
MPAKTRENTQLNKVYKETSCCCTTSRNFTLILSIIGSILTNIIHIYLLYSYALLSNIILNILCVCCYILSLLCFAIGLITTSCCRSPHKTGKILSRISVGQAVLVCLLFIAMNIITYIVVEGALLVSLVVMSVFYVCFHVGLVIVPVVVYLYDWKVGMRIIDGEVKNYGRDNGEVGYYRRSTYNKKGYVEVNRENQ